MSAARAHDEDLTAIPVVAPSPEAEVRTGPLKRDLVAGLEKGLAVIEAFDQERPRLTISEVAGRTGYVTLDMSPGYGFSGIVIAMLAALNPLGVVAAAIFIAGVLVGADSMSRGVAVPTASSSARWRR